MHRITLYYPDGSTQTVWAERFYQYDGWLEVIANGKQTFYGFFPHTIHMNEKYGE